MTAIQRDIEQLWVAHGFACKAQDYDVADFLVKVAVRYVYVEGLVQTLALSNPKPQPQGVLVEKPLIDLPAETEMIIGTVTETIRHGQSDLTEHAFKTLLHQIYLKGVRAPNKPVRI